MRRLPGFRLSLVVVALLFALPAATARAAAGDVTLSGARPAKKKSAETADGKPATLYGPAKISKQLRETEGNAYIKVRGVTYDPNSGSEIEFYLFDAAAEGTSLDPANYIGTTTNVAAGGKTPPVDITLEIKDGTIAGRDVKTRTNLRAMNNAYIAVVMKHGKLRFKKAVLSTQGAPTN